MLTPIPVQYTTCVLQKFESMYVLFFFYTYGGGDSLCSSRANFPFVAR